ncbi:MAG: peptidoglycan-binding domain-containing protein [Sarcina sp.]
MKTVLKYFKKINNVGSIVAIDGVFGEATAEYVKEFQKAHGLYVDGIVGNQTMKKLDEEVKKFEDIHNTKPSWKDKEKERNLFIEQQAKIYKKIT